MEIKVDNILGEYREDYYVQPLMKRVWAVELDILNVIANICKRHNIKYYGWYGTLLGAVRHQGFIPWDDDIDLAMLREDYEKFQYFAKIELPAGWGIYHVGPALIRVRNTDVIRLDQEFLNRFHGCPFMIGIDIFCLDRIPQGKEQEELWANLYWAVANLHRHWDLFSEDPEWEQGKREQLKEIEILTGYHFDEEAPVKDQLYTLGDKIAAMYWDTGSEEMAVIINFRKDRNYRIPRYFFDKIVEAPFECTTIPVLKDYDLPCKLSYGKDYMTPVRVFEHDNLKKQIDILRNYCKEHGQTLPECFNMIFEKE